MCAPRLAVETSDLNQLKAAVILTDCDASKKKLEMTNVVLHSLSGAQLTQRAQMKRIQLSPTAVGFLTF